MPINTVYETFYPDRSFYSVEKAGFITVGQLLYTMTNDILGTGSFRVVRAFYKDTQGGLISAANAKTNYSDWPIGERKFEFVDKGNGYSIGETLILNDGNAVVVTGKDFAVEVTKVDPATGAIMEVSTVPGVQYIAADPYQPQPMIYSTGTSVGGQTIGSSNTDHASGTMLFRYMVSNSYGTTQIATEPGGVTGPADGGAYSGGFLANYGLMGSGWSSGIQGEGTAALLGDKWPTTPGAIWAFQSDTTGNVKVGQEIFINSGVDPTVNGSAIPPGTKIISKKSVQVISSATGTIFSRKVATQAYYYQLSNVVTIGNGQVVSTRGFGAKVKYDTLVTPEVWDVILESTGAVDPLSDQAGVTANVKTTVTSSNIMIVKDLATVNRYKPSIYPGQRVVSVTPLLLLASATAVGNVVTGVTSVPHKLNTGDTVRVTGATQTAYNGLYSVTVANSVAISYTAASTPSISPATGPIGIQKIGAIQTRVFVESVTANSTMANVRLTTPLTSVPANEEVQFVFEDPQFWRLRLRVTDPQTAEVYVGTELQVTDDGDYSYVWGDPIYAANGVSTGGNLTIVDVAGIIGNRPTGNVDMSGLHPWITVDPDKIDEGFVNRKTRVGSGIASGLPGGNPETYPINYTMTITNRGLFFGIWESNWSVIQRKKTDRDSFFNWVLVQRPVNRINGETLTKGRTPLFCVNSVGYKYWKFVVREADMQHPTVGDPQLRTFKFDANTGNVVVQTTPYRVPADQNSQDSFAIINSAKQIALTEESKFLVSFLHNLTTPRFRYSEELDMMAQTSADVCMAGNDLAITAYTESLPRKYRAMPANDSYNTGLRVAILRDIPTLPEPNVS